MELDLEMSKVAFDLDGVLVPDFDKIPNLGGLDEFYSMSTYIQPIFKPTGEYYILTARPAQYRPLTWEWCQKYLDPLPKILFHERSNETSGKYKSKILNENTDISIYIESDPGIVSYLKKNVRSDCEIVHFNDYLVKNIANRNSFC
jgi:hypothetical protein